MLIFTGIRVKVMTYKRLGEIEFNLVCIQFVANQLYTNEKEQIRQSQTL